MIKKIALYILTVAAALTARAEAPVNIGVRASLNSSNFHETRVYQGNSGMLSPNWRCGFNVGAVVDIPMTHSVFLQPGFYFSHRNDGYATSIAYVQRISDDTSAAAAMFANGHVSTNWFHIPVMVSYRFTPLKPIEIQCDLGPYISFGIGGHDTYTSYSFIDGIASATSPDIRRPSFGKEDGQYHTIDWGFEIGAGIKVARHYYFGVHYLLGVRNLAKNLDMISRAHSREWQFTLGYDF